METAMNENEVREAYRALPPFPEFPGEREWPDRLPTPEAFEAMGEIVAGAMRVIADDREELERRRAMFPALWDVLFKAFPPDPLQ
jgi:hypothetical protein